jgi:hypothetical protein
MGMEKHWKGESDPRVVTYDTKQHSDITNSDSHDGFDNDLNTMNHLLKTILRQIPTREFSDKDMR